MVLTNFFTKQLKPYEITPEQWGIISVLDGDRATTQKELAEAIDRDQTTVVRMIHSLEKKEIVERKLNEMSPKILLQKQFRTLFSVFSVTISLLHLL